MAHDHHLYMLLADSAAQQGDTAGLRHHAPQAEELAARDGHRLYLAIAQRAWGVAHRLAGDYAEAEGRLTQALALFHDLGTGWQIGRTLFALAELALARADADAAGEYFRQALAAFEAMKAAPEAARTQAALAALGSGGERVMG
jgi:tetratricopeptide (TPR) repeat protein